ncbi:ABC transporter ATP-binding protein [Apibacter mensalis]|uniref:ABC transporter ATP-binding protein n=1 Tax=Apibacter mensalis TaxID=1586267 RepID=UPI0026F2251E|nr:ABC transporter ATP-binding protein [Apibacter mensalis]
MLEVKNLCFSYTKDKKIIESLSFSLKQGNMLALVGESGSGKSTILKLVYGLFEWESGEVIYRGKKLAGFKGNLVPGEPEFKYLEQDFGLMPYATVGENVGKFLSNIDLKEKQNRIMFLLDLVGMADYVDEKPISLSGGQKQRVALAKALAQTPSVLLLDEPFSQVDTFKKNILKRAVFDFAKENNISIILATHEIEDALAYADEMMIVKEGKIIRQGNPHDIYRNPENTYVANLFGENSILKRSDFPNLFEDLVEDEILIYPHQFIISQSGIPVKVIRSYFMGSHYLVESISKFKRFWFISDESLPIGKGCFLQFYEYQKLLDNKFN